MVQECYKLDFTVKYKGELIKDADLNILKFWASAS